MKSIRVMLCSALLVLAGGVAASADDAAEEAAAPDFAADVRPILTKYCAGCHSGDEPEGGLSLENFAALDRGNEEGKVVVPGKPDESKLLLVLEKQAEPFMPPEDSEQVPAEQVAVLRAWIARGARPPAKAAGSPGPMAPKIPTVGEVRSPIHALAWSPDGKWLAAARHAVVEILAPDGKWLHTLEGHAGHVNQVGVSANGSLLWATGGDPGLAGEVVLWNTADWTRLRSIRGHGDSIYAADLTLDGKRLATGSYDRTIKVWETATGSEIATLEGHHGPVFGLAFHPGGNMLASASDDRTVKLWDVQRGERLDTLIEPVKAQYAVAFSPDGRFFVAGGVDNRIRVWEITQKGKEGTNLLRYARFAHEGPILALEFSPDGRTLVSSAEDHTLKLWDTQNYTQRRMLDAQPDWTVALAISPDGNKLAAGRLDGSLQFYESRRQGGAAAGGSEPIQTAPFPELKREAPAEVATIEEAEPNNAPGEAMPTTVPATVNGVLAAPAESGPDADLFRFSARQGETWMIEAKAHDDSPVDTKVEVLHADGSPVLRMLLRAIRDSSITFRPIDSSQPELRVTNWEEMQLNQYMYLSGEVCRLYRAPRGPDSGFRFYTVNGKRRCYFDTSGMVHANEEPVYIVEPYAPGAEFASNGLPVFPLYYANDDDGLRKIGPDSRLSFTAPADGEYLVRVTDVRGFGGEEYKYSLSVRVPQPSFAVSIDGKNAKVPPGGGRRLRFKLDRIDDFEGEVRIDVANLPQGYHVATPVVVQAGHVEAESVVYADSDAQAADEEAWKQVSVTATARINGEDVVKQVGDIGKVELQEKAEVLVRLEPDWSGGAPPDRAAAQELVIQPGSSITAMLTMERNGFDGELKFEVDNLPHGVIVDDIGLSGILIRKGESQRQVFLTAADWVPETTRWIHAVGLGAGNPASPPIKFRVGDPSAESMQAAVTPQPKDPPAKPREPVAAPQP